VSSTFKTESAVQKDKRWREE